MPTLEELQQETVWREERVPPSIQHLRQSVLDFYAWPGWRIGTIGDHRHLKGYHRSRAWIRGSRWSTKPRYSTTETEGNRHGGENFWIAGVDVVTNEVHARSIYTRIRTAKLSGRLPKVREVRLESEPWHVHIGIDRGHAGESHTDLFALITNMQSGGTTMVTVTATMPRLLIHSEGTHVVTWQTLLNRHGVATAVDGDFGPQTDENTKELQRKFGAESVDGVVGPETWVIGLAGEDQI